MFTLFVVLHVLVGIILILVVLLQSGKAGDLSTAFGGGGGQTAFGSRSAATVLTKATTVSAVIFMVTSLGLSIMSSGGGGTLMQNVPVEADAAAEQPAVDTPQPAAGEQPAQETSEAVEGTAADTTETPPDDQ